MYIIWLYIGEFVSISYATWPGSKKLCLSHLIFYPLVQNQWHADFQIFKESKKACGYQEVDTDLAPF